MKVVFTEDLKHFALCSFVSPYAGFTKGSWIPIEAYDEYSHLDSGKNPDGTKFDPRVKWGD